MLILEEDNEMKIAKQKKIRAKLEVLERDIPNEDNEMKIMTERIEKIKTSHLVFSKSIKDLGINELLQHETIAHLKANIEKLFTQIEGKECVLEYTSDKGQKITTAGFIHGDNLTCKHLFVFHQSVHDFFFNPPSHNSYFTIDLLKHRIAPTRYGLSECSSSVLNGAGAPRNWVLEGSVDGNHWSTLSQYRKSAKGLKTASWTLQNPKQEQFRFIRFKETGNTVARINRGKYLIFGGIEIYGTMRILPLI